MKYVLLKYATARRASDEAVGRLTEELIESGEFVYAVGLGDPTFTQVVEVREGRPVVSDRPYVDGTDALASFGIVDVASHDRALEVAARTAAVLGPVEVRPLADGSDGDAGS